MENQKADCLYEWLLPSDSAAECQGSMAAWQETLEETGFNPFQTDVTSILTQLSTKYWRE